MTINSQLTSDSDPHVATSRHTCNLLAGPVQSHCNPTDRHRQRACRSALLTDKGIAG